MERYPRRHLVPYLSRALHDAQTDDLTMEESLPIVVQPLDNPWHKGSELYSMLPASCRNIREHMILYKKEIEYDAKLAAHQRHLYHTSRDHQAGMRTAVKNTDQGHACRIDQTKLKSSMKKTPNPNRKVYTDMPYSTFYTLEDKQEEVLKSPSLPQAVNVVTVTQPIRKVTSGSRGHGMHHVTFETGPISTRDNVHVIQAVGTTEVSDHNRNGSYSGYDENYAVTTGSALFPENESVSENQDLSGVTYLDTAGTSEIEEPKMEGDHKIVLSL